MNRFFLVGLTVLFLLFFGCDKKKKIDSELIEIELGKTAKVSNYDLSLKVENIDDCRCPIGARCAWEGYASAEFQLTTKKGKCNFTLDTHSPPIFKNDTTIDGIKYQLKEVLPYPVSGEEQPTKIVKILVGN